MLPKTHRLLFQKKNSRHSLGEKRYRSNIFDLVVFPESASPQSASKFGFIVSARISKKAVVRNRVKRLLREAVRHLLLKIKPGLGIIIVTKSQVVEKDLKSISEDLESLFQKAGLLKL